MNFQELEKFRKNLINKKRSITTEETTKISLILPFFRCLGYDIENPDEVKAEYACDVGVKTSEKVDLAILIDDKVQMLVECKSVKTKLNSNHLNQLLRYYSVSDCKIAVLTNGIEYWFFTDSIKAGRMDSSPFLIVDIVNDDLSVLELFSRDNFNVEKIEALVDELKYRTAIREKLLSEFSAPSDEFVSLIAKKVNFGRLTSDKRKMFKKVMSRELEVILANVVVDYRERDNPVITTPEEIEGFYIVRSILSEIIDSDRVVIRDRQSYCAIFLDDNQNYTICRLYFNDLDNLAIALFDSFERNEYGSRVEEKIAISKVSEIYGFREKLLKTVRVYLKEKK
jgi:hypothetical protein